MNKKDLSMFCCLSCKADLLLEAFEVDKSNADNIKEGLLYCDSCWIFYPITETVPFLLDSGYYEYFDMKSFLKKWEKRFKFDKYRLLSRKTIPEKLKQINFYNEDSNCYDDLVSNSRFWKASDYNILNKWMKELPSDSIILDIGCGTGRCAIPLAQSGRKVLATDLSIGMLKKAIAKSNQAGVGNITYFLADAEELPLKNNSFNTIISFGLMHHVNEPASIIKEAKGLLKNQGIFYALENSASPLRPIFDMLMKTCKLWNEEAGKHPLFKIKEIKGYICENGMQPDICTSAFLPPHIFNFMSYDFAKGLLFYTDSFFGNIPFLRNCGGQLVIKAVKQGNV